MINVCSAIVIEVFLNSCDATKLIELILKQWLVGLNEIFCSQSYFYVYGIIITSNNKLIIKKLHIANSLHWSSFNH